MFSKYSEYIYLSFLTTLFLSVISCDHGSKPVEEKTSQMSGISGKISYANWPTAESLYDLRLVVFNQYPPENIFDELSAGRAHVYPAIGEESLPFFVDTIAYTMELEPGFYEYVAVAQQYGPNIFEDWLAAGQYDTLLTDGLPTPITVQAGEILDNINFKVDFDSLPPQPF